SFLLLFVRAISLKRVRTTCPRYFLWCLEAVDWLCGAGRADLGISYQLKQAEESNALLSGHHQQIQQEQERENQSRNGRLESQKFLEGITEAPNLRECQFFAARPETEGRRCVTTNDQK
ncbi:MAG: hypothetical protein P8J27_07865, partial [Mariniblastus sp.]|nr:hypothetical protein [Mariniblastus sp.]